MTLVCSEHYIEKSEHKYEDHLENQDIKIVIILCKLIIKLKLCAHTFL